MPLKKTALVLLLPLALAACDSNQPTYSASDAASAPPPPPPQAQPQAPAPAPAPVAAAPTPAPAPAAEPQAVPEPEPSAQRFAQVPAGKMGKIARIGVGGCDEYVRRYRTCFNATKIPHGEKFQVRRTLMQQVRKWKADTAAGKLSAVAVECTEATRAARAKFQELGCKTF